MKKTAFVTGASGGFGTAIIEELLSADWYVVAGVRSRDKAQHLLQLPKAQLSLKIVEFDITQLEEKIDNLIKDVAKCGEYKLLINNAGMVGGDSLFSQSPKDIQNVFDVNYFGPLELIKKSIPILEQNNGTIVSISSIVGSLPLPFMGAYSSSKHALNAATLTLALESQHKNINFILFEPGPLDSKLCYEGIKDPAQNDRFKESQESMKAATARVGKRHGVSVKKAARKLLKAIKKDKKFSRFTIGSWATIILFLNKYLPSYVIQNTLAHYYSVRLKK